MSSSSSTDPSNNNNSLFKKHFTQISSLIEQGLSYEESGNYNLALQSYTKALQNIRSCLQPNVHHHPQDFEWIQRMKRYRDMFEPHVIEVQAKFELQRGRATVHQPPSSLSALSQQYQPPPQPSMYNTSNNQNTNNNNINNSSSSQGGFFSGLFSLFGSNSSSSASSSSNGSTDLSSSSPASPIESTTLATTTTTATMNDSQHSFSHHNARLNQMQNPLHRSSNIAIQQQQQQHQHQQPQHSHHPNCSSSHNNNRPPRNPHLISNHTNNKNHNHTSKTNKNNHVINNNNNEKNSNLDRMKNVPFDKIPEFKGIDKKLLDHILNEVVQQDHDPSRTITWDDVAGLKDAKQILHETIVLPSLRPDIFQGLRAPARGVLLFGPPGNGKTLIAKVVSSQCKSTFFSISASSLVSKWVGDGEKLVKALFAAADYLAPSVIFIDEIDSILTSRSSNEHEASRRLKTEFLVQIDGVTANTSSQSRVLVMGATNRPFELDDAILRRFMRRIYIPLPDAEARVSLIKNALGNQRTKMSQSDYERIAKVTDGYSGSDLRSLCQEASMIPIREMGSQQLLTIRADQLRVIQVEDFIQGAKRVKPSVSGEGIRELVQWNKQFGTFS